jgi:hypothetical protein
MKEDFYSSRRWLDIRYRVLRASNGCCSLCKERPTPNNPVHVDHIKPRSKYPELELDIKNLQVLCKRCNLGKSNTDETDWRWVSSTKPSVLVTAFECTPHERALRRDLLDRWVCGSTKLERESAKRILDVMDTVRDAEFQKAVNERKRPK